jgi:hypothetical protein
MLAHQIVALDIDAGGGDVTVRAGATPDTVVVNRKTRSGQLAALGPASWQGNTLSLASDCPGACGDVDYEVVVPDRVTVTVHTGSGDIELDGSLGAVSLQTGSGDVDADVTTSEMTSRTGSGDMALRLRTAPAELAANSGSGDVDIRLPSGQAYAVDSKTGSGDMEIDVPRQAASDHRVQVQTGSGDISLHTR